MAVGRRYARPVAAQAHYPPAGEVATTAAAGAGRRGRRGCAPRAGHGTVVLCSFPHRPSPRGRRRVMAKSRLKKPTPPAEPKQQKSEPPKTPEPLDPKKAHQLLGLPDPYEPPPPPGGAKGFVTFWDPGVSIRSLVKSLASRCSMRSCRSAGEPGNTTPDEWSRWERLNGSKNTEEQWLACSEVGSLLCRALELRASDRKMRLFGCACCRMFWHYLVQPTSKAAVEAAERFAVGEISAEDMYAAAEAAAAVIPKNLPRNTDRGRTEEYLEYLAAVSASEVALAEDEGGWPYWERLVDIPSNALSVGREQRFGLDREAMQAALCDRLRDIMGNRSAPSPSPLPVVPTPR